MSDEFTPNDTIEEELVAYLDGELDEVESSRIERQLAEDAAYRSRLQRLQQAWDMLDYLPRAQASEIFTQSTVELVAVKAAGEVKKRDKSRRGLDTVTIGLSASLVFFGLMLGYIVTRVLVTSPNRQLVRDLPVITNLDLYYHVDDLIFLHMLDHEGVFQTDLATAGSSDGFPQMPTDDERRAQIENLRPDEKDSLLRKSERFYAMSTREQNRLWKIHGELKDDPKSAQLFDTLNRYVEWLKSVDPVEQAKLQGLAPADRVREIVRLRKKAGMPKLPHRIPAQDIRVIMNWLDKYLATHEDDLVAVSPEALRPLLLKTQGENHKRILRLAYFRAVQSGKMDAPLHRDFKNLGDLVSEQTMELLRKPNAPRAVIEWYAAMSTFKRPSDMDLRNFYQTQLTEEERRRVDNLPAEERKMELRRIFIQRQRDKIGLGGDRWGRPSGGNQRPGQDVDPRRPNARPQNDHKDF